MDARPFCFLAVFDINGRDRAFHSHEPRVHDRDVRGRPNDHDRASLLHSRGNECVYAHAGAHEYDRACEGDCASCLRASVRARAHERVHDRAHDDVRDFLPCSNLHSWD